MDVTMSSCDFLLVLIFVTLTLHEVHDAFSAIKSVLFHVWDLLSFLENQGCTQTVH